METVGFVGLGNMGSPMASHVQKAGYPIVVFDVQPERTKPFVEAGGRAASSPAEVARLSDVIFTSLPGPKEVEAVGLGPNGILEGIKKGGIWVDMSTSTPSLIRSMEPQFNQKGAHLSDAPVSGGGPAGAISGNLAIMVGADPAIYQQIKPILDAMGDKVSYAGATGAGHICKLVHNMMSASIRLAIAEGMTLGVKAGVEARPLWEAVRRGAIGKMSGLHEAFARTILQGKFEPAGFALELARKDIGLATDMGREFDVPLPIANYSEQVTIQAMNRGWAKKDAHVVHVIQEENAGAEVRAPEVDPVYAAKFITTHPDAK